jgi:hypothetical protein
LGLQYSCLPPRAAACCFLLPASGALHFPFSRVEMLVPMKCITAYLLKLMDTVTISSERTNASVAVLILSARAVSAAGCDNSEH